jgi:hypothetical protein
MTTVTTQLKRTPFEERLEFWRPIPAGIPDAAIFLTPFAGQFPAWPTKKAAPKWAAFCLVYAGR